MALQTELFELLGFDHFELIQLLLEHRTELVRSHRESKGNMRQDIISAAASKLIPILIYCVIRNGRNEMHQLQQERITSSTLGAQPHLIAPEMAMPTYGCQVMVQSEEERLLKKQTRKEEKKIQRILNKIECHGEDQDTHDQTLTFDPVNLRTKRQAALTNAQLEPIFKGAKERGIPTPVEPALPFVFDNLAQAKSAAGMSRILKTNDPISVEQLNLSNVYLCNFVGFVQGVKLQLPLGFERKDEKKFEEYTLPAVGAAPVDTGKDLVEVSALDEIGQVTFQGIKRLNRIQSVVFDSAYHTNQNLLVCAPTGAGKTNVAMLCITQAIRQNIVNGVIKKDAFKIVYVAPMKALAAEMTANFGKRYYN